MEWIQFGLSIFYILCASIFFSACSRCDLFECTSAAVFVHNPELYFQWLDVINARAKKRTHDGMSQFNSTWCIVIWDAGPIGKQKLNERTANRYRLQWKREKREAANSLALQKKNKILKLFGSVSTLMVWIPNEYHNDVICIVLSQFAFFSLSLSSSFSFHSVSPSILFSFQQSFTYISIELWNENVGAAYEEENEIKSNSLDGKNHLNVHFSFYSDKHGFHRMKRSSKYYLVFGFTLLTAKFHSAI